MSADANRFIRPGRRRGLLYCLWLAAVVAFYALHFVHLAADFPSHSPWSDWAKYTDEGWYLNAATRHFFSGHWYLAGDFNPAVALPVWPLLNALLFHFTGAGILASRALVIAVFGVTLAATYLFVRRHCGRAVAYVVLSFAVTSPFLFAFGRLAIVEPLLLCLLAVALLLADHAATFRKAVGRYLLLILLGLLLVLMLLTKTTAVVLYPAIGYVLWQRLRVSGRAVYRHILLVAIVALAGFALYYAAVVHSPYLVDYRYLFSANQFPRPTSLKGMLVDLRFSLQGFLQMDAGLSVAAAAVLLASCFRPLRMLWRNPVYVSAVAAIGGNFFFVFWRNYQPPHYYLFAPVAMGMMIALGSARAMLLPAPAVRYAPAALVAILIAVNAWSTVHIATHPQYTLQSAADSVARYIDQHPSGRRLLLSESGDQISLMTGLPAMGDDFGTIPLHEEIAALDPGWFAAWTTVDPKTLAEIHLRSHLQKVAAYEVMDDPRRNLLVLYRLVPLTVPEQGVVVKEPELQMQHRP